MGTQIKLRASQKKGEAANLDRHWRGLFLDTLAETSNVSEAARRAGASTSRAYKTKQLDPEFRRQWNEALHEGYEHLEMETLHRLRFGTTKEDNRFDIPNALRLLAMHAETVARERARRGHRDKAAVLASLNAKIDKMRERKAAAEKLLAEHGMRPSGNNDGN